MPLTDSASQKTVIWLRRTAIGTVFGCVWYWLHNALIARGCGQIIATLLGLAVSSLLIPLANWFDFLLFRRFDLAVMQRIPRATGLLKWYHPATGPIRHAWDELEAWVKQDAHHGRWSFGRLLRLGALSPQDTPFRYALLLGVNGIGKSQLAMELGRHLADRKNLGSASELPHHHRLRRRAAIWWRRAGWPARHHADPWDAGLLDSTQQGLAALTAWRPSAPTFLILDDPDDSKAGLAKSTLAAQSVHFWYPVRLLIVAQFRPPALGLTFDTTSPLSPIVDPELGAIKIVQLGNVRWNAREYSAAASGGYWQSGARQPVSTVQNKKFWDVKVLEPLVAALDGNPLLLAEAAIWLAAEKPNTVQALLNVQDFSAWEAQLFPDLVKGTPPPQALVIHRIIGKRMKALYDDHIKRYLAAYERATDIDQGKDAVITAIIRACIAGETQPDVGNLKSLLPASLVLPPSWPLIEDYTRYAIGERQLNLDNIILQAYRTQPAGTLRALRHQGELADKVAKLLETLPDDPTQPELQRDLFAGAAYRALWLGRDYGTAALTRLNNLHPASLPAARAKLYEYGTATQSHQWDRPGTVPDIVVALLLLTALGAREFPAPVDLASPAWQDFWRQWTRWLERCYFDMQYVPVYILEPLTSAFVTLWSAMLAGLWAIADPERLLAEAEKIDAFYDDWLHIPLIGSVRSALPPIPQLQTATGPVNLTNSAAASTPGTATKQEAAPTDTLKLIYASLWHAQMTSLDNTFEGWDAFFSPLPQYLAELTHPFFTAERKTFFTGKFLVLLCRTGIVYNNTLASVQANAERLDQFVLAGPFANSEPLQAQRALAWRYVAKAWSKISGAEDHAAQAVALVQEIADDFPRSSSIIESLAHSLASLAYSVHLLPAKTGELKDIIDRLEVLARQCNQSSVLTLDLVFALTQLANYLADNNDLDEVEKTAKRAAQHAGNFPDHAEIQRPFAFTQSYAADARARRLDPNRPVDIYTHWAEEWIKPFADSKTHQERRASIWRRAAAERSHLQEKRATTAAAATQVDAIANRFPTSALDLQANRAWTWRYVAFAWSKTPELRAHTWRPLAKVFKIAKQYPDNQEIQFLLIGSWKHLAFALSHLSKHKHLMPHVISRMRPIAAKFPYDQDIQTELTQAEQLLAPPQPKPAPAATITLQTPFGTSIIIPTEINQKLVNSPPSPSDG